MHAAAVVMKPRVAKQTIKRIGFMRLEVGSLVAWQDVR